MADIVCQGKVAVVGNGPLTEDERKEINDKYDCVVRFNDMKNKKKDDVTTLHVSRYANHKFPGLTIRDDGVPTLPIIPFEQALYNIRQHVNVLPSLFVHESHFNNSSQNDEVVFKNCIECKVGDMNCNHSFTPHGPSTGTIVIDKLQEWSTIESIDVYGMNWNGGNHHIDFKQPDMVEKCCSKCTIHKPNDEKYDNRTWSERKIHEFFKEWKR